MDTFCLTFSNLILDTLFLLGLGLDSPNFDEILYTFDIKRSLSHKGTPYDNAVAEANFKSLKFEFVYQNKFNTLKELEVELGGHIWCVFVNLIVGHYSASIS